MPVQIDSRQEQRDGSAEEEEEKEEGESRAWCES